MARLEKLTAGKVFAGCTKKERRQLDRLSSLLRVEAGAVLTREGQRGHEFGVIVDGTATVTVGGQQVARLGAGDHFGEIAMLDRGGVGRGRRTATITADVDLWVAICSEQELSSVLAAVPWVTDRLLASAADRIAQTAAAQRAPASRSRAGALPE